mgnify:CR=1 FL=1
MNLNKKQNDEMVKKLIDYCEQELEIELGQFDAEFLLHFIGKEMGAVFYNQGLYDAQAILQSKFDDLSDAISEIEKVI